MDTSTAYRECTMCVNRASCTNVLAVSRTPEHENSVQCDNVLQRYHNHLSIRACCYALLGPLWPTAGEATTQLFSLVQIFLPKTCSTNRTKLARSRTKSMFWGESGTRAKRLSKPTKSKAPGYIMPRSNFVCLLHHRESIGDDAFFPLCPPLGGPE